MSLALPGLLLACGWHQDRGAWARNCSFYDNNKNKRIRSTLMCLPPLTLLHYCPIWPPAVGHATELGTVQVP